MTQSGACWRWAARAVVCWAVFSSAGAWAASVQVDVVDEAGRPVNGAVAFLESAAAKAVLFTSEMSIEASVNGPRPKEPTVRSCPLLGETTGVSPSRDPCMTNTPKARSMA